MSEPLRLAIVDDEPLARRLLASYAAGRADLEPVGEAASGTEAVELIEARRPELILLDIEMPGADGFDVLGRLHERGVALPLIVFVTAFDRYAVRAFEMNAVDYLLKPVTLERFDEAIDRCRARTWRTVQNVETLLEDTLHRAPRRLLIRSQRRIVPVPVESIDWIQAAGDYVKVRTGEQEHLLEYTLKEMEKVLSPAGFTRIHRSAIVNVKRIKELRSLGSARLEVVLQDGSRLPVSRTYSGRFRDLML